MFEFDFSDLVFWPQDPTIPTDPYFPVDVFWPTDPHIEIGPVGIDLPATDVIA